MIKKIILTSLFFIVPSLAMAQLPQWTKTEKHSAYPQDNFITAVGSGADAREAEANAQKAVANKVMELLEAEGAGRKKADISLTLLKQYKTAYKARENNVSYALGVIEKNLVRMDVENDLYLLERELHTKLDILDASDSVTVVKVKEMNDVLALFERRQALNMLKKILRPGSVSMETMSFEMEQLITNRKNLFNKISYYIKDASYNFSKLRKYCADNGIVILTKIPDSYVDDKAVIAINPSVRLIKTDSREADTFKYDWAADIVLSDAYQENVIIYSDTTAGSETSAFEDAAKEKARLSAESELNDMVIEFLKSAK